MQVFTRKKKWIFIVGILIVLLAAAAAGYFGYGATLLNPNSDASIKSVVSKERHGETVGLGNKEVEILVKKEYGDYFAVLYNAVSSQGEEEAVTYFSVYKKHKGYVNRYEPQGNVGSNPGGFDMTVSYSLDNANNPSTNVACFFANTASNVDCCSVFECDDSSPERPYVRKVDAFTPPQNEPYIIVKEYDVTKAGNSILCFDGAVELSDIYGEE